MAMTPIKATVICLYFFECYMFYTIVLQIPVMYRAITSGFITMIQRYPKFNQRNSLHPMK